MNERHKPQRVLIVDDTLKNIQVLGTLLREKGYQLNVAQNGVQALKSVQTVPPDLILLDVQMPEMDGFETCRRLKASEATRDIPVIFLTARVETEDIVKGFELGAVDYITKPFNAMELLTRVNTHLTIHRLQQRLVERNRQLDTAYQRMKRDLDAAARVQQALLPSAPPALDRARFAWSYYPCDELAGDALNVFKIDERFACLYVLDVSGHGVPAALLAVAIMRHLSLHADRACFVTEPGDTPGSYTIVNPADVAQRLNAIYPMASNGMHYFTLLYGILDTHTGDFRFVSAGHPGPIRMRPRALTAIFDAPAPPVGIAEDVTYEETVVQLQPGDRLYVYSDGLYEERNAANEAFGRERLCKAATHSQSLTLSASVDSLVQAVAAWRGNAPLRDDISIIGVEIMDQVSA